MPAREKSPAWRIRTQVVRGKQPGSVAQTLIDTEGSGGLVITAQLPTRVLQFAPGLRRWGQRAPKRDEP